MAIKLQGNTVITDSYVLQGITDVDPTTRISINNAIVAQSNVLIIYASDGSVAKQIFGATNTPS